MCSRWGAPVLYPRHCMNKVCSLHVDITSPLHALL